MCEPTTIAAVALTTVEVGSAVVKHKAQNKAADANAVAANESAEMQQRALTRRLLEERIASGQDVQAGERQSASAISIARLSALESGVQGASVDAQQQQLEGDLGRFKDSVAQNLGATEAQIADQRLGVDAERRARINGVPGANPFLTGLTIAGSGLDLYTNLKSNKPPTY